jgi:hypothetical protein
MNKSPMTVAEFVNAVIGTVGERCRHGSWDECAEWSDHACVDVGGAVWPRCTTHCVCVTARGGSVAAP